MLTPSFLNTSEAQIKTPRGETSFLVKSLSSVLLASVVSACGVDDQDSAGIHELVSSAGSGAVAQNGGEGSGHRIVVSGDAINPVIQTGEGSIIIENHTHYHQGNGVSNTNRDGVNTTNQLGKKGYFYDTYRERLVAISNRIANSRYSTELSLSYIDAFVEALDLMDNDPTMYLSADALVQGFQVNDGELIALCQQITEDIARRHPQAIITGVNNYCTQSTQVR